MKTVFFQPERDMKGHLLNVGESASSIGVDTIIPLNACWLCLLLKALYNTLILLSLFGANLINFALSKENRTLWTIVYVMSNVAYMCLNCTILI